MSTITLTDAQITQAFEDWENDYRANKESFLTREETDAMAAATCAEGCTIAFKAYVRQRSGGNDLVTSQALQPLAVGEPVGLAGSWYATVQVEVYALGRGVTLAGQEGHLAGREGTLELEAAGVGLVFDPLAAEHTQRLVLTVECDVGTVFEPLEAIDEECEPELALAECRHGVGSPLKTAILSLPQGIGKTTVARQLAAWLGCVGVVDEWAPGNPMFAGALHLTNVPLEGGAA